MIIRQLLAVVLALAVAAPAQAAAVPFWVSAVAKAVPYDNATSDYVGADVQTVLEELRTRQVWTSATRATSGGGTHTLAAADVSLHFYTGTATGYSIALPDATTLFRGRKFELSNNSTQPIALKDAASGALMTLGQSSVGFCTLQTNAVAAGGWVCWQVFISSLASGILNYQVVSSADFVSASTTDVAVTGFTVTPQAGTYAVWFNISTQSTSGTATNTASVFSGGVKITDSERAARMTAANSPFSLSGMTVASFDGSQACDVRVRTSSASQTVKARTLLLIRLGS